MKRTLVLIALSMIVLSLAACTRRNPEVCCETSDECLQIGTTEPVLCETGACVNSSCVTDGTCNGPEDCDAPDVCANGVCTSPGPDAGGRPAFDVAYPSVWRRSVPDQLPFDLIVINTSTSPLSMSSLVLKSISDDHPTATVRFILAPLSTTVATQRAGGLIVPLAEPVLIGSGLVPETRVDTNTSYVDYEIVDPAPGTYDITADAILTLDGIDVPLHFVIHMVPGPTIYADPEQGTRASFSKP